MDKETDKAITFLNLFLLGLVLLGMFFLFKGLQTIDEITTEFNSKIGDVIIIDGDSLTIVDAFCWKDSYSLSNGVKINSNV